MRLDHIRSPDHFITSISSSTQQLVLIFLKTLTLLFAGGNPQTSHRNPNDDLAKKTLEADNKNNGANIRRNFTNIYEKQIFAHTFNRITMIMPSPERKPGQGWRDVQQSARDKFSVENYSGRVTRRRESVTRWAKKEKIEFIFPLLVVALRAVFVELLHGSGWQIGTGRIVPAHRTYFQRRVDDTISSGFLLLIECYKRGAARKFFYAVWCGCYRRLK